MEPVGLAPPRLAPVSGVLNQGEGVIKPIACRPVVSSTTTTPVLSSRRSGSQQLDDAQSFKSARTSCSMFSSTSDLPHSASRSQRLSWNRSDLNAGLCSLPPEGTPSNRISDLSKKFGGSLCSVATGSPHTMAPNRHRPPPYRLPAAKSSLTVLSNSEVHLDRVSRQHVITNQQRVIGGSEMNLNHLSYTYNSTGTLPRTKPLVHRVIHADNSLYSCSGGFSSTTGRSSWAGLPSGGQTAKGSSTTLASDAERREDNATPIVEEGKIMCSTKINSGSGSLESLTDFDGDCAADGTPSPSDSGVAELEALLKEKDSEIALLRETLEQNEAVIFQVYQEKEKSWERELKKLHSLYEERMKAAKQQAAHAERQLQQLQQQWQAEKKTVKSQTDELKSANEDLRSQLDETSWTLCHKNGELSLVKSQLKEAQGDQNQRCQEVAKLRAQLREAQELMQSTRHRLETVLYERQQQEKEKRLASSRPPRKFAPENADIVQQLKNEIHRLQRSLAERQHQMEVERQIWEEEKSTVMMYQRHLQQQYIQAMKRNQQLEETLGLLGFTGLPPVCTSPGSTKNQPLSSPKSVCSDPITVDLDSTSNSSNSESQC